LFASSLMASYMAFEKVADTMSATRFPWWHIARLEAIECMVAFNGKSMATEII
jgi:hypothetical protein